MRKYAGQLHIGAQAEAVVETKKKEDDFFGSFENAELKQQTPVEQPATRLVQAVKEEKKENDNLEKLTVDMSKAWVDSLTNLRLF